LTADVNEIFFARIRVCFQNQGAVELAPRVEMAALRPFLSPSEASGDGIVRNPIEYATR